MSLPLQDSLNVNLRYEASLDDFSTQSFVPIIDAIQKLSAGSLRELLIVGGHGFGKTHLASAIYRFYTSTTTHTAISIHLGELIEKDLHAESLTGLEMFDLLIIDDLQLIKHSYDWQAALFHLINRVRDAGKQMLFFSDSPAREIHIGLLDLQTRLSLIPMLHLPSHDDINEREVLISTILKHKNWRLPEPIFDYLLHEGPRNAGDIITVLDHIAPLLTNLSRNQVPKKTISEAKAVIERETFVLEVVDYHA